MLSIIIISNEHSGNRICIQILAAVASINLGTVSILTGYAWWSILMFAINIVVPIVLTIIRAIMQMFTEKMLNGTANTLYAIN